MCGFGAGAVVLLKRAGLHIIRNIKTSRYKFLTQISVQAVWAVICALFKREKKLSKSERALVNVKY